MWERGLKRIVFSIIFAAKQSLPMWERGLKQQTL